MHRRSPLRGMCVDPVTLIRLFCQHERQLSVVLADVRMRTTTASISAGALDAHVHVATGSMGMMLQRAGRIDFAGQVRRPDLMGRISYRCRADLRIGLCRSASGRGCLAKKRSSPADGQVCGHTAFDHPSSRSRRIRQFAQSTRRQVSSSNHRQTGQT